MNHLLSDIIDFYVLVYLDEILVYNKTADNYEKHLCEVFSQLWAYKLWEKRVKCEFGYT